MKFSLLKGDYLFWDGDIDGRVKDRDGVMVMVLVVGVKWVTNLR